MPTYNFRDEIDHERKARKYLDKLIKNGSRCKMESIDTRTSRQNSALHLFCKFMANELNDSGALHRHESALTNNVFHLPFTTGIIKEHYWRPVQEEMFKIKSTKDLDTKKMNEIVDVLIDAMANKGLVVEFPNMESFIKNKKD